MRIFVCYTMRDGELTRSVLEEIYNFYSRDGDVFLDVLTNNSKDKQRRVIKELNEADRMIIIETSKVYLSDWVQLEIDMATSKRKPIEKIKLKDLKEKIKIEKKVVSNNL